ncbi:hypothetical protein Atai01_63090 [Amycolatopsis taiwanensis]|uniref:Uncharacterized protein n=1 Tax=Amycolatopsis taiwanensis TaxID=342230 RepID=A0A9W6R7H5_9PSEU|nr:hypothetical protein Atai01_63090 [Amycolatopsis taiwanensis]
MPGRSVRDEGIPPLRAPALGDPLALEHEVRYAAVAEVLAHRDAGLATADDDDLDFLLVRHAGIVGRVRRSVQQMLLSLCFCSLDNPTAPAMASANPMTLVRNICWTYALGSSGLGPDSDESEEQQ